MKDISEILISHEVRLFSAVSISGAKEAEMRATSALLSVVKAVSEFGRFFTKMAGAGVGSIECYTEIPLKNNDRTETSRLDGIIKVTRGKKEWKALVEVKVGTNGLDQKQFDKYHNLAKDYGLNALITISNQPALPNGHPPLKIDLRKAKSIPVIHLSWERLLSEAQLLSWQGSIADEDHRYILNEWIRYVNDTNAKIVIAPTVGGDWNGILSAASEERLASVKKDVEQFANSWTGFMRIQAFRLRAKLAENVELRIRRDEKKKPELLTKRLCSECVQSGKVQASLIIPHTAGDLDIVFDLRARRVFFEVQLTPPSDKMAKGQISWVVNQLKKIDAVSPDLSLIIDWKKRGVMSMLPVNQIEERKEDLMYDTEKRLVGKEAEISAFKIQWKTKMSRKKTEVFSSIGGDVEKFYQGVVQRLKAYQPPAPKVTKSIHAENDTNKNAGQEARPQKLDLPSWNISD